MRSLASGHGYAAVIRTVTNRMYGETAAELFKDASALSMAWDGASYSGSAVNIAFVMDCISGNCAHLRPQVDWQKISEIGENTRSGGGVRKSRIVSIFL